MLTNPGGPPPFNPEPERGRGVRIYWRISAVVIGLAILYSGGVLWSRWESNRDYEKQQAAKQREQDQAEVEMMGGGKFDILNFYATPAAVNRGESIQLCYGVSQAKSVTLEPQSNPVWPSYSRCVDATPRATTTYTLTATDASGNKKSASLVVHVR